MSKSLQLRLNDAKLILEKVDELLRKQPGSLPSDAEDAFRSVANGRDDIDNWLTMIDARAAAMQLLAGLESTIDSNDMVPFGDSRAKFVHVRFVGVLAYVAINWALADRISELVGTVLCTPDAGSNPTSPVQLVSHFFQEDRKKKTASTLYKSLRSSFGWPVGLSYAIRNHFFHDGGQLNGFDFFEASESTSGFRVRKDGWARIESVARDRYHVDPTFHRLGKAWPVSPCDDLRDMLSVCERETDDALGVLLGTACNTLRGHVMLMTGQD